MDNWIKPLPKHTKMDYYECYAKIVLEKIYPNEFINLKLKDKPDLQTEDGKYGIEVTNAIDERQRRAESVYSNISYEKVRNIQKSLDIIEKCGCRLVDGVLVGRPGKDSFELILESFNIKLNLLNGEGYSHFEKNCLFVFSDILADDIMIIDAIQDMQKIQMNKKRNFCKVFVLVSEYCYSLDLYSGTYQAFYIPSDVQFGQASKVHKLVEEYEKKI